MNFAHILAYADFAHLAKKEKKKIYIAFLLSSHPHPNWLDKRTKKS